VAASKCQSHVVTSPPRCNPAAMWHTLRRGNNLFTTTLSVLVSAVQKLSTITVIPDGLKLCRGTGGLVYLPERRCDGPPPPS
jgi:hypothetical protein